MRLLALFVLISFAGFGCARFSDRQTLTYTAFDLPDEYRAPPTEVGTSVDLSRFAATGLSNTVIGPGDILEVTINTGFEKESYRPARIRVSQMGTIQIPLVGQIQVAGMEATDAEQVIASEAIRREIYRQPVVTVIIERQEVNKITVVGAVETPGPYELQRGASDLLGAIAAAGGLSEDAGVEVEVLRKESNAPYRPEVTASLAGFDGPPVGPPPTIMPVSRRIRLTDPGSISPDDNRLNDGDVVMVFPRDPRTIHVMGLVNKGGDFQIPPDEDVYLLDALAMAGGRTQQLADVVHIIRRSPLDGTPMLIKTSVRRAKSDGRANLRLAPGDVVNVEETPVTFIMDSLRSLIRVGVNASTPLF